MAAIAQRAATSNNNSNELIDMSEIEALLAEQKEVQEKGQRLLEQAPIVAINN
jgi:hypothetical protein